MKLRTSITAGLALLLTAGTAWSATSAPGKATRSSAKPAASSGSKSRVKKSSKHSKRRERGQKAPAPERISEIQQALAKDGSFTGTPNGKWDDSTVEAMKKFQVGHGLNPSGKLDALSLEFSPNTSAQFATVIQDEIARYAKLVKQSGAKAD